MIQRAEPDGPLGVETEIGLQEALRLSTEFSLRSGEGAVPASTIVPIPASAFCRFVAKPWGDVDDGERESFRRFYTRVGDDLEGIADTVRNGGSLDEVVWDEITAGLRRREPC